MEKGFSKEIALKKYALNILYQAYGPHPEKVRKDENLLKREQELHDQINEKKFDLANKKKELIAAHEQYYDYS